MKKNNSKGYKNKKRYKKNLVSLLASSKSNRRYTLGAFGKRSQ